MNQNPKGHEHEYKWLKASEIKYDETYQRPINQNKVNQAVREFNGDIFNEPKVSYRPGDGFYCFDGRRSTAIWQNYHNNPDQLIYTKIFYGMTWDDEVEAFIKQFGFKEDVAQSYKLRAKYNRKDADVVDMVSIITNLGWSVDFEKPTQKENQICAVVAAYRAYTALGANAFTDMMQVIREAWGGMPEGVSVQILGGMKDFYKAYYGNFKHNDLAASLRSTMPYEIIRKGKANNNIQSHTYATEILKQYNYKRRNKLENKL